MNMFELIKQRVSILDVVREYTALKKAGGYWKGRCPFHHEKTASFTVSPERHIFYCFGCHVSGDVIAFIARVENISGQREAARLLAERCGIELPQEDQTVGPSLQEKERYFLLYDLVAGWASKQLKEHHIPVRYLEERGFAAEIINRYKVGYFPSGASAFRSLFVEIQRQNFLIQDLVDMHIIVQSKGSYYSPFEERVWFPISDALGRTCGFGGRIFKPNDERPKYYNTKESDFFVKGSLLFGFDQAKKAIQEKQVVCLVEGYTDCLAMVQHGFTNTVATLGTACTQTHLKLLSRHADVVYVLYDADNAGVQAILRMTQLCWQVSMELKVVTLPPGTDPALFLMQGGDLNHYITKAQDIFLFYVHTIGQSFISAPLAKKLETLRLLLDAIVGIDDILKRDLVLHQASQALCVPVNVLSAELQRARANAPIEQSVPVAGADKRQTAILEATLLEKKIACAILNNTNVLDTRSMYYLIRYMSQPLAEYVRTVVTLRDQGVKDPFHTFYTEQAPEVQQAVGALMCSMCIDNSEQTVRLLFKEWQRQQWKKIVADIKDKIADATIQRDTVMVQNLIAEFNRLKQEMVTGVQSS